MLVEAALATLVIIAVTAGIGLAYKTNAGNMLTGLPAWQAHYGSWAASTGLGSKLNAVVIGFSNIMSSIGISYPIGVAIIGVFIASFAGTTLDSATRIQRYIVSELFSHTPFKRLTNKWSATAFAVICAALLAFSSGANGKGALMLWPLFGAVNQLLASLALMVATLYLRQKTGKTYLITGIPCILMISITIWAGFINQISFIQNSNIMLIIINALILILSIIIAIESLLVFFNIKISWSLTPLLKIRKTHS